MQKLMQFDAFGQVRSASQSVITFSGKISYYSIKSSLITISKELSFGQIVPFLGTVEFLKWPFLRGCYVIELSTSFMALPYLWSSCDKESGPTVFCHCQENRQYWSANSEGHIR